MSVTANPRLGRTHRKRISALRLSSDTTNTLPEYWRDLVPPPEYDADDNDSDGEQPSAPYIPPVPVSPRRRSTQHRRRPSSPLPQDAFIDSLLERSVHALELSNALLQSSLTPTSSAFRDSSPTKAAPIPMPPSRDETWAHDLAKITRDVDELLVSSSLPPAASPISHRNPRRRPSLDTTTSSRRSSYLSTSTSMSPTLLSDNGLRIAAQTRSRFVAHAPRALTQYVDVDTVLGAADESIALPSTLGLRSAPSDWRITGLPSEAKPVVSTSTRSPEPSTPAYNMLSSFVQPKASSTSPKIPARSSSRGRAASRGSRSSSRADSHTPHRTGTPDVESSSPLLPRSSPGPASGFGSVHNGPNPDSAPISPPSTFTTHSNLSASIIATLPSESSGHSPQSSDDGGDNSVDGCRAKEARSALRKILEEAPPPPRPPVRKFHPRSPPPLAHTASSTATASVSRLFSKGGRHSVSTPPERVVGIMKRSSAPGTPITAAPLDQGEGTSKGIGSIFWMAATSRPGSGSSTPRSTKRISFAELPESYAGSRPGGPSALSKSKSRKSRNNKSKARSRKGKGRALDDGDDDGGEDGERKEGWLSWLVGGSALGLGFGVGSAGGYGFVDDRDRDRDRVGGSSARAMWGGGTAGGLSRSASDEWAV
ncbi:hypothetical protein C8F01DRAFT_1227781 [Mycena amicta]|nr:hypothetical protein C8F01DRAFT_1227781 [Mycena amicta]